MEDDKKYHLGALFGEIRTIDFHGVLPIFIYPCFEEHMKLKTVNGIYP